MESKGSGSRKQVKDANDHQYGMKIASPKNDIKGYQKVNFINNNSGVCTERLNIEANNSLL
jgi:hypothetical protein